jgi:hypothetical protein
MKNQKTHHKTIAAAGTLLTTMMLAAAVVPSAQAYAQEPSGTANITTAAQQPASRPAREMKIALLPVVNLSGEKDAKQRQDQSLKGNEELRKLFTERGFQVLDADTVRKTLETAKIDMSDEEFQNRATLYRLGKEMGADLIAFVVITDVEQQRVRTPLLDSDELVAKVKTKTWLLDVPNEQAILSAKRQESQSRNNLFPGLDSGARRIRNTVAGCVRDSLRDFLREYPTGAK